MVRKVVFLAAVAMLLPTATVMAFHQDQCDPCHIPHMAGDSSVVPLWSGTATATAEFINYDSDTMDADTNDPANSTLLCLACHDGASRHSIIAEGDADGDLSGTHPLEMAYTTALATTDGELVDPNLAGSSPTNPAHTIADDMLEAVSGKVKCFSCHDIHASGLGSITVGTFTWDVPYLVDVPGIQYAIGWGGDPLVQDDYDFEYAALCTTCHEK